LSSQDHLPFEVIIKKISTRIIFGAFFIHRICGKFFVLINIHDNVLLHFCSKFEKPERMEGVPPTLKFNFKLNI